LQRSSESAWIVVARHRLRQRAACHDVQDSRAMTAARPHPWSELDPDAARRVLGVFTDIDDTLTREGAIDAAALAALERLQAAGIHVVAITGRPMGWSEPFARSWPVDAIV